MAKTKTPFFGLGSSGSVGGSITTQKRGTETLVRGMPFPAYRRTLSQVYQRWLYEDYAYLWRQQDGATRQAYATSGARYHLTGYQYWLKYHLAHLPDIVGGWRLDRRGDAVAIDFGKRENNGVIVGPTPVAGIIDGALYFDGINDRIEFNTPVFTPATAFSCLEFYRTYTGFTTDLPTIMNYHQGNSWFMTGGFEITLYNGKVRPVIWSYTDVRVVEWACPWGDDEWHSICVTYDETTYRLYTDGAFRGQVNFVMTPATRNYRIGRRTDNWGPTKGTIDNPVLFNRCLDPTEIKRWAERRYPP